MVSRIPMSKKGHKHLRQELEQLERRERPDVVRAIEVARAHGDLSENAEYHAAKERQGMIEGRILELKDKLVRAEVIDCSKVNCDRAVFGTIVTLVDMDTDEEVTYQLLGPEEADVKKGSISVLAPLGRSNHAAGGGRFRGVCRRTRSGAQGRCRWRAPHRTP